MENKPNTERFSNRVADYVKYRPSYPTAVLAHLRDIGYLTDGSRVADVGAGTGIFTKLLLDDGADVVAVEPNHAMAGALRETLLPNDHLRVVSVPAEATTLEEASVDLITVAQALHWFEPDATRAEFIRITTKPHRLAAAWNSRDESNPFIADFEELFNRMVPGYAQMTAGAAIADKLAAFFGNYDFEVWETPNGQQFDWESLVGRVLSSSYGPKPGTPAHEPVMAELRAAFERHERDGRIDFTYVCRVYTGGLT